eukprot:541925_1
MSQTSVNKDSALMCIDRVKQKLGQRRVDWDKVEQLLKKSMRLYETSEARKMLANLPEIKKQKALKFSKDKYDEEIYSPSIHNIFMDGYTKLFIKKLFPDSLIKLIYLYLLKDEFCVVSGNVSLDLGNQIVNIGQPTKIPAYTMYLTSQHYVRTFYGLPFYSLSKAKYKWKIKCSKRNSNDNNLFEQYICIGIASSTKAKECDVLADRLILNDYIYCRSNGFESENIIGIELDLNNKWLSFSSNDKNFGVEFENIYCHVDIEYRLAVCVDTLTVQAIQIIDFNVSDVREIKT